MKFGDFFFPFLSLSPRSLPSFFLLFQAGLVLTKWPTLALSSWHPSAVASWSPGLPVQAICSGSLHHFIRHCHRCQCSTLRMFYNLLNGFSIEERGMLCSYLSYCCQTLQGISLPIHLLPLWSCSCRLISGGLRVLRRKKKYTSVYDFCGFLPGILTR